MSDIDDDDIDDVVDSFFDAREAIFEHVGYVEDWRVLPIDDSRDQFWAVDKHEREWVKFSSSREALAYWLESDDYGPHGDKLYENQIYTQRHLSKWVYRGEELTLVVADTNTDGNKYLQLFRNENEVRSGEQPAAPVEQPEQPVAAAVTPATAVQASAAPNEHPLNHAIDRMIEADAKEHAEALLGKVRAMCEAIPLADLKIAITVHQANCHQENCPVLFTMEEVAEDAEETSA